MSQSESRVARLRREMRVSLVLVRPLIFIFNGAAFSIMRLLRLIADHSHTHVHSPDDWRACSRPAPPGA